MRQTPANQNDALDSLIARFEVFKTKPFPKKPAGDMELVDLHGLLAEYDVWIGGYISRIIQGERFHVNRLGPDPAVEKTLRRLAERKPECSAKLQEYQNRYDELQTLIDLADRVMNDRRRRKG